MPKLHLPDLIPPSVQWNMSTVTLQMHDSAEHSQPTHTMCKGISDTVHTSGSAQWYKTCGSCLSPLDSIRQTVALNRWDQQCCHHKTLDWWLRLKRLSDQPGCDPKQSEKGQRTSALVSLLNSNALQSTFLAWIVPCHSPLCCANLKCQAFQYCNTPP